MYRNISKTEQIKRILDHLAYYEGQYSPALPLHEQAFIQANIKTLQAQLEKVEAQS